MPRQARGPKRWMALAAWVLGACGSTAPYALPAAGINTAVGLAASARARAQGGCYATCTGGMRCNPRTGFCEAVPPGACQDPQACAEVEAAWRRASPGTPALSTAARGKSGRPGDLLPGLGVSPLSGTVPPPPSARPSTDAP